MRHILFVTLVFSSVSAWAGPGIGELLSKLEKAKDDSNKVLLYHSISGYYISSKYDSAVIYTQKGLELSKKINYRHGEPLMLARLSFINQHHGNYEVAGKYCLEALAEFKKLGDLKGIASCNNGLGVIEGRQGNFSEATRYFISALKLYEKMGDVRGVMQTCIKLGVVDEKGGNLDRALKYYTRARQMNEKVGDAETGTSLVNNMGIIYAKKGDMEKALLYFEAGISKSEDLVNGSLQVSLLTNAGSAHQHLGNRKKALEYHKRSLKKAREFSLPEEEARALLNMATILKEEDAGLSIIHLTNALRISKKIGNKELTSEIYAAMAEAYKQQENYREALVAIEEHHKLLDSLFSIDKERAISNLQAGYELDKSREHIKTLELINKQRTLQRNAGIAAAFLVFCILILLWLYLKRVRKLNNKLHESNQVKDKLFSIIGHDLRSPVAMVSQLLTVMEDTDLDSSESRPMIAKLKKHTDACLATLDTLLHWGRAQLKGIRVNKVNFHVKNIIEKNLKVFQTAVAQKSINIEDLTASGLVVYADPDHFDFIIRNLLSNAIKFSHEGGKIEISAVDDHQPGFVRFMVKDNGLGLNETSYQQLFGAAMRSAEGTSGEKGSGIGLMLSKEFVLANQGQIGAESREGEGAVFFFTLKAGKKISGKGPLPADEFWPQPSSATDQPF